MDCTPLSLVLYNNKKMLTKKYDVIISIKIKVGYFVQRCLWVLFTLYLLCCTKGLYIQDYARERSNYSEPNTIFFCTLLKS